jgi:hypothetical protein
LRGRGEESRVIEEPSPQPSPTRLREREQRWNKKAVESERSGKQNQIKALTRRSRWDRDRHPLPMGIGRGGRRLMKMDSRLRGNDGGKGAWTKKVKIRIGWPRMVSGMEG